MNHRLYTIVFCFLSTILVNIKAQDTSFISLIVSNEKLNLSGIDLVTVPMHGTYMLGNNKLYSLEDGSDMSSIIFPDSMLVDDIIWSGDNFILKSGYEIYAMDDLDKPLMDFDTEDYSIFPWDEKRFFIVCTQGDTSRLFMANKNAKKARRLLTIGERIVYVVALGKSTMVVTSENIYMFTDKECKRFLQLWEPVHTAVMTDLGLAFATDSEICILTGEDEFILLFGGACKKLLYDSRYLFLLTKSGDLIQCNLRKLFSPKKQMTK